MDMKSKAATTFLYSTVGVVVMAAILVAVNIIGSSFKTQMDLTAGKIYTLSPGTRKILAKLDTPVTIRFYCTQGAPPTGETVYLQNYASRVSDLLGEFQQAAPGKIIIKKLDPEPDSDAEDSAQLDGIQPITLPTGDKFYLGLAVSMLDSKQTVQLSPARERLLEYDVARAISRVMRTNKPVVGVMSSLSVFGGRANPMMMQQGQQPPQAWSFINELKGDYTLRQIPLDTDKIDKNVKLLILIHPHGISNRAQFAIDQFVLRGGRLIAFLDPFNITATRSHRNRMMPMARDSSSTLSKLLPAWGVSFDTTNVVADLNDQMQIRQPNGQAQQMPAFLDLTPGGLNTNDVITSTLHDIWLPLAGTFSGTPTSGLKETVLMKSTGDAEKTDAMMASMSGENILKNFKTTGVEYPLAIQLTGKFKTAFPDGEPTEGTNAVAKSAKWLKKSAKPTSVILVGDADMLADDFALRKQDTPFGTLEMELNDNLSFALNAVEQLSGDSNLIAIRSRGVVNRPFTRIKKMQAAAEAKYEGQIKGLQQSLSETEERLSQLQRGKSQNQRFILSPEQQTELQNFRKKEAQVKASLKQTQKDLRHDIVSLETRIEWWNIAAMPALVSAFGLGLAIWKRNRTRAK